MSIQIPDLPMTGAQLHTTLTKLRDNTVSGFSTQRDLEEATNVPVGSTADTPRGSYNIVPVGEMTPNGITVLVLVGTPSLAVLNPNEPLSELAELWADTRPSTWFSPGDKIIVEGQYVFEVADDAATDHDVINAGGTKFYANADAKGRVSARALGCVVVGTWQAAQNTQDTHAILQAAMDRGRDVTLDGWVNLSSQLVMNGNHIEGSGRRISGFFCSEADAGIVVAGQGANIESMSVMSDFTATHLVTTGDGMEGSTNDASLNDLFVEGARERNLLVREFANGDARFCKFRRCGRRTGTTSIDDEGSHSVEIRCIFRMVGCDISSATGWSLLLVGKDTWEETRLFFVGGRIVTGAQGLLKVVGYSHEKMVNAILENAYFENAGITDNPGVNNPNVGAAIVAQGPGAFIDLRSYQKGAARKATSFLGAYDGGRINVLKSGPVFFQSLGSAATGNLIDTGIAEVQPFAAGLLASDGGMLVSNNGITYASLPEAVPFTTTSTFDANQWIAVPEQTQGHVSFDGVPQLQSSDAESFSTSDWSSLATTAPQLNNVSFDFGTKTLVRTLLDGSSTAPIAATNPNTASGTTLGVTTTASEYLSGTGAVTITPSVVATPAQYALEIDITPDLVNQFLMLTSAWSYIQHGPTFGSAGSVRSLLRVDNDTAAAFPTNGTSKFVEIAHSAGNGTMTGWYKGAHLFQPTSTGKLRFVHMLDTINASRNITAIVDNVKLWAVRSHDFGAWT
ncbi:MAG: hypothetical protein MK098_14115 [Marinovum sp.]|nr:hypothetical protein [Marinovum sp.]